MVGVTLAHPPAHSLHLKNNHYDPAVATDAAWVKILTWRANGDGFGLQGNAYMEDCFIRANDVSCQLLNVSIGCLLIAQDASYVGGRGMKRIVLWNDSNGAAMVLSHLGSDSINSHEVEVQDTTVIYARCHFGTGFLGCGVFNMRGKGGGSGGHTVTFSNIVVEDTRPTFANFKIRMEGDTNNSYIIYSI